MPVDRLIEFASNHWMMISGLLIVLVLLIQDIMESAMRKYKVVSALSTVTLMNQEDTLVLDVREPDEYAKGHIDGARLMTLGRVAERAHELESHKNKPIVVVCQSGTRSPEACKILMKQGFNQVHNLAGGMMEWEEAKLPVTSKNKK
ncbi:rhodanese-like domain-containing protein [Methylogaea oryzae]|uniref:Rhodanese-like domain-containing protein n=1 Tax=Methylogaea oryzae TaxID=1295382 RepID=A0A8D4VQ21_9GAMM|nr:rhodanese-like domain-containing protein [Methylogaea oryzae]BBL71617.1 rhodanese-like domain-containing protein [Methylogaea oryzae]